MQTLSDIISYINSRPDSEKGRLFEILCLYFLKHDTLQQNHFSSAWLWKFWPGNEGKTDTGIDIAAKILDSDSPSVSFCAVQCKFRQDDSAITKSEIDSFLSLSSKAQFSERILFTLTGNLSRHALDSITNQNPPVKLLTLQHLEASSIDWSSFSFSSPENVSYTAKTLLTHQVKAVNDVMKGFSQHDRGRLIMACGTGKTFTSLKIAEKLAGKGGLVLVLVPSISLLNQTLLAWSYDHDENIPLQSFAVCSDSTVGRYAGDDSYDDLPLSDLAIPPTTDADTLLRKYSPDSEKMTVIFSTYQSLHVLSEAQKKGFPNFGIVICDEAHRTAGITLSGQNDSLFRKIHDASFIRSRKRLYMTATPKVYGDDDESKAAIKQKAQDRSAVLYDMDDPEIFGPVFHWLTFSQAVEQNLLADYKVIVFMTTKHNPSDPDLPSVIQGVRKALAKDISPEDYDFIETDSSPMHRAVAFSNTIKASEQFAKDFM
ncbi:MAG: DEAD/DEAH box helicase family protein, partial [Synergistaceae bacterium]|nr:DEAD/DEAH box helicase family protein [Synergistaceae bacterium]